MSRGFVADLTREFGVALDEILPFVDLLQAARRDIPVDSSVRREIFQLGWPALALSEKEGGLGLGIEALAAVAAVAGSHLLPMAIREESFLLAPALAAAAASDDADATRSLDLLLVGEGVGGGRAAESGLVLEPVGNRIRVQLEQMMVWLSPGATDAVIVTPEAAAVVPLVGDDVFVESAVALDRGQGAHRLTVDVILPSSRCFDGDYSFNWWQRWRLVELAGLVGAATAVLDLTLDHASARKQFGKPITKFQAVSHMLAEMKMRTELARSAVSLLVANAASGDDIDDLGVALAYAVPKLVRETIEYSIQIHGGTGFTWEYGLHLYYRRVLQSQVGLGGVAGSATKVGEQLLASRS